ncbi:MAG: helix-turn-helix transcriptional regulator [Xanthomonadaceae bacterium]|nr:helix-turn-helix transcriptional regulator [Xanthomonadaceae bacterium]
MGLPVRKNRTAPPPPTCALGECMNLLRPAWAANVVWYLGAAPRRFGELRRDLPSISARVLSARLRTLESQGVVERRAIDTSPPTSEYLLTDLGRELIPALRTIVAVGEQLKQRPPARPARHSR